MKAGCPHFQFSVWLIIIFLISSSYQNLNVVVFSLAWLNKTELVFLFFLGMPSSKMSLQPQHTESPRTTAQSWESESSCDLQCGTANINHWVHSQHRASSHSSHSSLAWKVWRCSGLFFSARHLSDWGRLFLKSWLWTDKNIINHKNKDPFVLPFVTSVLLKTDL